MIDPPVTFRCRPSDRCSRSIALRSFALAPGLLLFCVRQVESDSAAA
jgi:hypothetical protein